MAGALAVAPHLDEIQRLIDGLRKVCRAQLLLCAGRRRCSAGRSDAEYGVVLEHHIGRTRVRLDRDIGWPSMKTSPEVSVSEAGQDAQQRGLAAAGRPQKEKNFAAPDLDETSSTAFTGPEVLGDILQR